MKLYRMRLQLGPLLVLLAALTLTAVGCADDTDNNNNNGDGGSDTSTGDMTGGDGGDTTTTNPGCNAQATAGGDNDGDGIANGIEDANLNCMVDAGETDPNNADSDNDGLTDGEEDINGNGIYEADKGESDPNNSDSDGDGIPDSQEITSVTCTRELLTSVSSQGISGAQTVMALPPSYTLKQQTRGATFSNPATNSFGWIASVDASSQNPDQENGLALLKIGQGLMMTNGNLPTVDFSKRYAIPGADWAATEPGLIPVPNVSGVRAQMRFAYGPGQPNSTVSTKDPAQLRDEVLAALTGSPVSSGDAGTACATISAHWVSQLRINSASGSKLIVAGIATCEDNLGADENLRAVFDDLLSATIMAPGEYQPEDFLCEELEPRQEAGKVDFLWVIDNSGSMADEQANVSATVDEFLTQLGNSGIDARLGVTTTIVYTLDPNNNNEIPATEVDKDEYIDQSLSGLRDPGFISSMDPDVATLFRRNVIEDPGCDREHGEPDQNICGHGWERGIASALYVLSNLAANETAAEEPAVPHGLRADADLAIIFLSDEENQDIKPESGIPYLPGDPNYTSFVASSVAAFQMYDATVYSIVGDQGTSAGGVCTLLDTGNPAAVDGAQPGNTYIEVARETGGAESSICTNDLGPAIKAIIESVIGSAGSYPLRGYPISSSIRVAVDGEVVPRSTSAGWSYNADTNAILFNGTRPSVNSRISVAYLMWRKQGG